jgi:hypothetical protein
MYRMERGLVMVFHAIILGFVLYLSMVYGLGQSPVVAEDRSIVVSAVVLIYMILFGHGYPTKLNRHFV